MVKFAYTSSYFGKILKKHIQAAEGASNDVLIYDLEELSEGLQGRIRNIIHDAQRCANHMPTVPPIIIPINCGRSYALLKIDQNTRNRNQSFNLYLHNPRDRQTRQAVEAVQHAIQGSYPEGSPNLVKETLSCSLDDTGPAILENIQRFVNNKGTKRNFSKDEIKEIREKHDNFLKRRRTTQTSNADYYYGEEAASYTHLTKEQAKLTIAGIDRENEALAAYLEKLQVQKKELAEDKKNLLFRYDLPILTLMAPIILVTAFFAAPIAGVLALATLAVLAVPHAILYSRESEAGDNTRKTHIQINNNTTKRDAIALQHEIDTEPPSPAPAVGREWRDRFPSRDTRRNERGSSRVT